MGSSTVCEVCGFVAGNASGLAMHRKKMHNLYELTCRTCGVELTNANWLAYVKKATTRMCATCWKKRDKVYQHRRNRTDKARL